MKNWLFWFGCLAIAVIAGFYFWPTEQLPQPPATVRQPAQPPKIEPPPIRHPVAAIEAPALEAAKELKLDRPLPTLEQSDERMTELLAILFREQRLDRLFFLDHFIERFVVMIDNLTRPQLPPSHRPIRKIEGEFLVAGQAGALVIDPANGLRYEPMVRLLETIDQEAVIAVYTRTYPLFQQAYQKLGYPDRYFNDRLIEVLDHLLATPVATGQVRLVRPKFYYQFADPKLEALSAGQKIILRSGKTNAEILRRLMRSYRQRLAGMNPEERREVGSSR